MHRDLNCYVIEHPSPGILRLTFPKVLYSAYLFLPIETCEGHGLLQWVEILTTGEVTPTIRVSFDHRDWGEPITVNTPDVEDDGISTYRVPLSLNWERVQSLRGDVPLGISVCLEDSGRGGVLWERAGFRITVRRPERALIGDANTAVSPGLCRLLPVFITPDEPEVHGFLRGTQHLVYGTGVGGETKQGSRAMHDAEHLYNRLRENGFRLLATERAEELFQVHSQLVQFPAAGLSAGSGNCLDGVLLFASLMEAAGHRPKLALLSEPGHALVGWRRGTSAREFDLLDVTGITRGRSFAEAVTEGNHLFSRADSPGRVLVDVLNQRRDQVSPFPARITELDGDHHGNRDRTRTASALFLQGQQGLVGRVVFSPDTAAVGMMVPFGGRVTEFGRGGEPAGGRVRLADPSISSRHLRLRRVGGGDRIALEDLQSKNGTWLNGLPTSRGTAGPGDVLRIGDTIVLLGCCGTMAGGAPSQRISSKKGSLSLQEQREHIIDLWSGLSRILNPVSAATEANLLEALLVHDWSGGAEHIPAVLEEVRVASDGGGADIHCLPKPIREEYRLRREGLSTESE